MPARDAATAPVDALAIATPLPTPAPAQTRVAVLPQERPSADPDPEVTGSISTAADATIPVEIGESSSGELPVVLPRERPPILRIIERERDSRLVPRKRTTRRARTAAKPARPANVQPASEVNLFEALFDAGKTGQRPSATAQRSGRAPDTPPYPPIVNYPFGAK
jgi:hypothetical protein